MEGPHPFFSTMRVGGTFTPSKRMTRVRCTFRTFDEPKGTKMSYHSGFRNARAPKPGLNPAGVTKGDSTSWSPASFVALAKSSGWSIFNPSLTTMMRMAPP